MDKLHGSLYVSVPSADQLSIQLGSGAGQHMAVPTQKCCLLPVTKKHIFMKLYIYHFLNYILSI